MRTGLVATKIGMFSLYVGPFGEEVGLTVLKVDGTQVVGHKTTAKDQYNAVIVGTKDQKLSKLTKPMRQFYAKGKLVPKVKLKEFRVSEDCLLDVGTELYVDHFSVGQFVDVSGFSIGKGFAGSMKRHNFRGLEASHGVSISHRSHGSTGGRQDPGKVFKNKKMAGHMGNAMVTMQNLKIFDLDREKGIIMVVGSVPGSKGSYVYIKDSIKKTAAAV